MINTADQLDSSLIHATLHGNQTSYAELIRRHQPPIFLMVHRMLRQREEAEDVVQQVFLKAYQHLANFRGDSKFFTWLYTIALNLVRNHVRQRKLRRMDSLDVSETNGEDRAPQWLDKSPSLEKIVQNRWDVAQVQIAAETLKDLNRTIFTLHYFQHLSLKEVAIRVDRPIGTVKVYLHRARKLVLALLVTS